MNHAHESHGAAIIRRVNLGNTRLVERTNFRRRDGSTSTTKDADVLTTGFIKQLANVGEVLDVTALIGCECHGVSVFLNGAIHDGLCGLVVAQMDDFCSGGLNETTHDVDGGVMAVKQGRSGNDANGSSRC